MWVDLVQLQPSRLQAVVRLIWWGLVFLLVICAGVPAWLQVVSVLGLLCVGLIQRAWQLRQPQLLLLQQLDRSRWQWQQRDMPTHGTTTRRIKNTAAPRHIQARLRRVDAWLGLVLILRFEVTALGKSQTWLVWRDQVDRDNWRRLQVLQQYWSAPADP